MSPMERSLAEMRDRGYHCEITEHNLKIRGMAMKKDLFGFCDILCLGETEIVAVQTTSRSNLSARIRKIEDSDTVSFVRKAGIRILVQGWAHSKRAGKWVLTEVDVS